MKIFKRLQRAETNFYLRSLQYICCLFLTVFCITSSYGIESNESLLWSIGTVDKSDAEFAGFPDRYNAIKGDVVYRVGLSIPQKNWLYMQAGPVDAWAGGKKHKCSVLFSLKNLPPQNEKCKLVLYLKNNHKVFPPRLDIRVNGQRAMTVQLKPGVGDALMRGEVKEIPDNRVEIPIDSSLLEKENILEITTEAGSWLFYDAVQFFAPQGTELVLWGEKEKTIVLLGVTESGVLLWGTKDEDHHNTLAPVDLEIAYVGKQQQQPVEIYFNKDQVGSGTLSTGGQLLSVKIPTGSFAQKSEKANAKKTSFPSLRELKQRKGILSIRSGEDVLLEKEIAVSMPRLKKFYLFPHSHVDIGYTHRQDEVVNLQIENMNVAMDLIDASADNLPSAQFKWNPESLWVMDHYLSQESEENKTRFMNHVQNGTISLDALYGNLLTGLCRPEELYRGVAYFAKQAENITGVPIISAAICDVPGYTWGTIAMMGQAGIRYFAIAPNYSDRIGTVHEVWNDKPFYWMSQSGQEKVLCWVTAHYWKHGNVEEQVLNHLKMRQESDYPYDLEWMYWIATRNNGGCDNSPPDTHLTESVQNWNNKYAVPMLVIGTAKEFFPVFEKKYGSALPVFSGDMTPYWEDGAGSTSAETGMNRRTSDKLSQAETLWAMSNPEQRSPQQFAEAWKNILLYSEHTWGAYCSISKPDDPFTHDLWECKRQFAVNANAQAEKLLRENKEPLPKESCSLISVLNTTQWPRTELVTVPAEMKILGNRVKQEEKLLPTQRLKNGTLVFLAQDVPAFSGTIYQSSEGDSLPPEDIVQVTGNRLISSNLLVTLDEKSGAIKELRIPDVDHNFVDSTGGLGLNEYCYLKGRKVEKLQKNDPVTILVGETGPLVGSLVVKSTAPGCVELVREIRLVAGSKQLEIMDTINRERVREKDSVHIGFGFNVPNSQLRMETPWAVVRPNKDQLPGACKNWFTVQRWVDISNNEYGVLWSPTDAPLMEIGGITANLFGPIRLEEWMTEATESSVIYSWAQNNHWHTNYKADQAGVTTFRYVVEVHPGGYEGAKAARFGQETTRPLLVKGIESQDELLPITMFAKNKMFPLEKLNKNFVIETLKVLEDGKGILCRVQNMAEKTEDLSLGKESQTTKIFLTDLSEKPIKELKKVISIPAYGIVNLRLEWINQNATTDK